MTVLDVPTLRVWVDDRQEILRQGIVSCLGSQGLKVAGESADLDPDPDPDLIDVMVFGVEADTVDRFLEWPSAHHSLVALVPSEGADDLVAEIVRGGVTAVLLRADLHPDRLAGTIRAAHAGSATLPSGSLTSILRKGGGTSSVRQLAERELAVLRLLAEGQDTKLVGEVLGYSERTVKNIVHDALMKLECSNRVHGVAEAIRRGLI